MYKHLSLYLSAFFLGHEINEGSAFLTPLRSAEILEMPADNVRWRKKGVSDSLKIDLSVRQKILLKTLITWNWSEEKLQNIFRLFCALEKFQQQKRVKREEEEVRQKLEFSGADSDIWLLLFWPMNFFAWPT